ncbi:MAG: hypothetical protein AAF789_12910, partial [Bacteroidota bacterium]
MILKSVKVNKISLLFLFLLSSVFAIGQTRSIKPITTKYALSNANLVVSPGKVIEQANLIMEDGLIVAIGKNIAIPMDAIEIKADSMFVYPGFISGLSNIGLEKEKKEREDLDDKLTGTPPDDYAGITPGESVFRKLSIKEKAIADFKKLGFTAAHTVNRKGMLPGYGSIVLLGGKTGSDLILEKDVSVFAQLQGASGVYPNTVIGVMAKYRDLYQKSRQAFAYQVKYEEDPAGMTRPSYNKSITALFPMVNGDIPVFFKANSLLDIMRITSLQKELGFKLVLGEIQQGWDALPEIKTINSPVFLSLDLPEWKKMKEDGKEDKEAEEENEEDKALQKKQQEIIKKYYQQASLFQQNGIEFGFSTLD